VSARFVISRITPDDAEEVAHLLARVIGSRVATALEPFAATVKGQRAFIESLPERASYLAAVDAGSGAIVGVQDVLPNERDLRVGDISTFVDVERARTGVGAALTEASIVQAREKDFGELHAVIQRANEGARAFYRAQGFVEREGRTAESILGVRMVGELADARSCAPSVVHAHCETAGASAYRPPGAFTVTAFSFAAACVPMAYFQASGAWIMSKGLAEVAYIACWFFFLLPYCFVRLRQGRSPSSWAGLRDVLLLAGLLAFALIVNAPRLPTTAEVLELLVRSVLLAGVCLLGPALSWRLVRGRSAAVTVSVAIAAVLGGALLAIASRYAVGV